ncbi:MAG TPA: hypothetical protein VFG14_14265 [Chthoniobacteraceae bacterium]|jgi:hypothetical protein|nr:hypothetical protein [Chthoniobacteraceae bacterium]
MEQYLTVATFNEREPAETLALRLRDAGISADVFDESDAQRFLLMNLEPKAHMRVRVDKDVGERAIEKLREWDRTENIMQAAVRCPQCGSSRIEYPQFSRRTLMSAFPAAAAAAGLIEREYYCEACAFTWPAEEKVQPKLDVLNWPEGTRVP